MGYNIGIGNAKFTYWKEGAELSASVDGQEHPDAPDHCRYTEKTNYRSPSYGGWHDFCTSAGIFELFYGSGWNREERAYGNCSDNFHRETPFFQEHPGICGIGEADYEYVKAARIKREQTNGGKPPGFFDQDKETGDFIDNGKDHVLARLLWLEFWMRWALDNCEFPSIHNS